MTTAELELVLPIAQKGDDLFFKTAPGQAVLAAHEEKVSKFRQQVIDQIHGA